MARPPIDLAASIARVARGGIPLRAEERLPKRPARTKSCSPAICR